MTQKLVIRTSDRKLFKTCRQQWDFSSKIRMNYQPVQEDRNLEFGTAIHAGLEAYYNPETWQLHPASRLAMMMAAFTTEMDRQATELKGYPFFDQEAFDAEHDLGTGMLNHYHEWSQPRDNFIPLYTEVEFEVPVLVPPNRITEVINDSHLLFQDADRQLYIKRLDFWLPVVYQGRIDLIVEDEDGRIWVVDHKTAGSWGDLNWLDIDTQVSSYAWAVQHQMGHKIAGVIYNQIKKAAPHPPNINKDGALSKDKRQNTTAALYRQAIKDNGLDPAQYEEILALLDEQEDKFVRRIQQHRSSEELRKQGEHIYNEAIDMLTNPRIYPNPSPFTCNTCKFKEPCFAEQSDADPEYLLEDSGLYRIREPQEA